MHTASIHGQHFKVDYKVDIKRVHSGVTREYFKYSKLCRLTLNMKDWDNISDV